MGRCNVFAVMVFIVQKSGKRVIMVKTGMMQKGYCNLFDNAKREMKKYMEHYCNVYL